jgi:hypothetical protein
LTLQMMAHGAQPPAEHPPSGKNRTLGDEWSDWDGSPITDTTAGKRLFIKLSAGLVLMLAALCLAGWYLVSPRFSQWHPVAPGLLLSLFGVMVGVLLATLSIVAITLWFRWPLPRPLPSIARRLINLSERRIFSLGRRLAINRDRIAHSLIKVHNALATSHEHGIEPERVLVLLPRCLTKQQIQTARGIADDYGVKVAVVGGGELARKRIKEHRPAAVIGVACERDLVSGLRDVGKKGLDVLAIPNSRPNGPCQDTVIDLAELSQAIAFYVNPDMQPADPPEEQPPS